LEIDYARAPLPVRDDLRAAHQRQWARLARAGAWWTGAERVALAAEVRAASECALCRERAAALTPAAVPGEHGPAGALPAPAVDAVHRISSDPGRLSRGWLEGLEAQGLEAGPYVELLGVVVTTLSIDAFCRGIGAELHPLPEPQPGAPSHYRPAGLRDAGAYVPMLPARRIAGPEADLYGRMGRMGNVIRAMSLVPDEVRGLLDLSAAHYVGEDHFLDLAGVRSLSRAQMELVAGRVSALRECFY